MILTFCIIVCFHAILQTKQFSPKISLQLVSHEVVLDFNHSLGTKVAPKIFHIIFSKKLKIIPYCLNFYEHENL